MEGWNLARQWGDRIPVGVLYRVEGRPCYEDQVPALAAGALAEQALTAWTEADYEALVAEFI